MIQEHKHMAECFLEVFDFDLIIIQKQNLHEQICQVFVIVVLYTHISVDKISFSPMTVSVSV